jgi:PAS domain S-box-containing protein
MRFGLPMLQDTVGILCSQGVNEAEPVEGDKFLVEALNSSFTFSRVNKFNNEEIYEVVKSEICDEIIDYSARLLNEVSIEEEGWEINNNFLVCTISIIVLVLFTNQNLRSVSDEYSKFKSLTWSVFQNMDEAVIVVNKNKEIVLFNISAEKLFQKQSSKVIGKNLNDISSANFAFLSGLIAGANHNSVFEERTVEISGSSIHYLSLTKNYDEAGELQNHTIVMKDITSLKQLQEHSRRNEKLTAMGQLASGVAHEIRNPINVIGMVAQRLLKEFNPEENREEYLLITSLLKDEVTRINKIITQFLQFAKPLSVNNKEVKTGEFIEEIFRSFIGQANQKKINFSINNSENHAVNTDPDLLKQVLLNIVQNSFDAAEENGEVSLNYYRTDRKIIIEVKDNGKGIPEEVQSKIFDLYFTTKKEGNGLGLSISQKIINQLGGRLYFVSRKVEGTTFTIELPL